MYQARYYKQDGSKGSEVSLPTALFDGVVNESVLHQAVKAFLANQRQGTGSAKNRSMVRGGSRKPWRQKGTGRARQGTIRAAQWVGGGRAFPPQPHSWNERIPKQVRSLARRSAFNSRAEAGRVVVIESFAFEGPKTRQLTNLLASLETEGKVLLLTHGVNTNLHLSGRNLPGVEVMPFGNESPYHVIWSGTVVIEAGALEGVGDAQSDKDRPRRRPIDREALAAQAEESAARRKAREARPLKRRRIVGEEIDTSPIVETATKSVKAKPAKPAAPAKAEVPEAAPEKAPEEAAAPEAPAAEASREEAPAAEAALQEEAAAAEAPPQEDAADSEEGSGIDAAAVPLPKISELKAFLAEVTTPDDVKTLMGRDSRKTAGPLYEARLAELEEDS